VRADVRNRALAIVVICCQLRYSCSVLFDSHQQLKRAYDLSRGRIMLVMVVFWTVVLYLAMLKARKLSHSGVSLEEEGIRQIAAWKEQGRLEREAQMKK